MVSDDSGSTSRVIVLPAWSSQSFLLPPPHCPTAPALWLPPFVQLARNSSYLGLCSPYKSRTSLRVRRPYRPPTPTVPAYIPLGHSGHRPPPFSPPLTRPAPHHCALFPPLPLPPALHLPLQPISTWHHPVGFWTPSPALFAAVDPPCAPPPRAFP
ncbi:hypothetical protein B0H13DRAFT_2477238, partial [Mycena leptocephala]